MREIEALLKYFSKILQLLPHRSVLSSSHTCRDLHLDIVKSQWSIRLLLRQYRMSWWHWGDWAAEVQLFRIDAASWALGLWVALSFWLWRQLVDLNWLSNTGLLVNASVDIRKVAPSQKFLRVKTIMLDSSDGMICMIFILYCFHVLS